ncbi:hypothetical protein PTKIN_Ptkin06aG0025600 [Pterospermum kingtungense]
MFSKGDLVEVSSKEEGFIGSYFEAMVLTRLNDNTYKVQYKNLVEEKDETRPLVEIVPADEVRPMPPTAAQAIHLFSYLERVDAFDNDGWWVGNITGKKGSKYWVYFDTTGDELLYPASRLRYHLEWRNGMWVSCRKSFF